MRPLISCIYLVSAGRVNYLSHAAIVLLVATARACGLLLLLAFRVSRFSFSVA